MPRLLVLNIDYYHEKYGDVPQETLLGMVRAEALVEEGNRLVPHGMQNLVSALAEVMGIGADGEDAGVHRAWRCLIDNHPKRDTHIMQASAAPTLTLRVSIAQPQEMRWGTIAELAEGQGQTRSSPAKATGPMYARTALGCRSSTETPPTKPPSRDQAIATAFRGRLGNAMVEGNPGAVKGNAP